MRSRHRAGRALLGIAGALAVAVFGAEAVAAPCEPWPGEPDPLPSRNDTNPLRAEWAALRANELTQAAREQAETDRLHARQLWRRVLCLDPGNDEALAGVLSSPPVRLHRPALVNEPFAPAPGDAWAGLGAPLGLRVQRAASLDARQAELLALEGSLTSLAELVDGARFEAALEAAASLRERLAAVPQGSRRRSLEARTEVLAATAELALERPADATQSFWRALRADPGLVLDPRTTSPKVRRAFEAARGGAQP